MYTFRNIPYFLLIGYSCFGHAVSLAQKAFLNALNMKIGKTSEEDGDDDDEETEEEVQKLLKDVEAAVATLLPDSDEAKLLTTLLIKVRGFISKVSCF